MNENENQNGLWVNTYQLREKGVPDWRAFGDGNYFIAANEQNALQLRRTLQHGIDQIFEAYKIRKSGQIEPSFVENSMAEIANWLPDLPYIIKSTKNPTPIFFTLNINTNESPSLFENGYRNYSDGSTGGVCAFARNSASILDESSSQSIKIALEGVCGHVIAGFAKAWSMISDNKNQMDIYSTSVEGVRQITTNEFNSTRYVRARTQNQQQIYVYPILSDKANNMSCTFKYPIQLKRFGMYTSLDKASGNTTFTSGIYLARDFLNCDDSATSKYIVYYMPNHPEGSFGFTNTGWFTSPTKSSNVKLCPSSSAGPAFLTRTDNSCEDWE